MRTGGAAEAGRERSRLLNLPGVRFDLDPARSQGRNVTKLHKVDTNLSEN